ncbi:Alpha/Beta hydrolase protein [Gaertneriomyces semiglobifer]|nr:Alpha/Beta hydrolase protein [Gaertneriomyces semiglobifer]
MEDFYTVKCFKNVPYADTEDPKQTLDLYVPSADEDVQDLPVLVYVHGGSWRTGDKSEYDYLGDHLASYGIITAIISYRLSSKTEPRNFHPVHISDCARAVNWLYTQSTSHIGYTPSRIYLSGHSAGGQLTGLLTLQPTWLEELGGPELRNAIKGVIGIEGIYDIPHLINVWPSYVDFVEMAFTSDQSAWKDASPQYYSLTETKYDLPPYLIIQSPEDELIEADHAKRYYDHLRTFGKKVELMTSVKGTHFEMLKTKEFFQAIMEFIRRLETSGSK